MSILESTTLRSVAGAAGKDLVPDGYDYSHCTTIPSACQVPLPTVRRLTITVFDHDLSLDLDLALAGFEGAPDAEGRRFWGEVLQWLGQRVPCEEARE